MTGPGFQNVRTILGVPVVRERVPIGALILTPSAVEPFTDKQIELPLGPPDPLRCAARLERSFAFSP
jgi:hypothetical protein